VHWAGIEVAGIGRVREIVDAIEEVRVKLWQRELQRFATEIGVEIKVHHLPPGTSKWNKIEHRLFSLSARIGVLCRW
jgi:hypothetical protein